MKIVIAIDSFKGSLTSIEAGSAAAEGVRKVFPNAEIITRPLADGGEGTTAVLAEGTGGTMRSVTVMDALGKSVIAEYAIIGKSKTAVIEMSAAAGLTLVPVTERNPMNTTTYGVGEMIKDAIGSGCRKFIIGIGGSAANDGGTGMLSALGFSFRDKYGKPIPFGAKGLEQLVKIVTDNALPELKECDFSVACDVTNPLCGENGCSAVYAPQKGAAPNDIPLMDSYLDNLAKLTKEIFPNADPDYPGAGAAGGMGFAFMSYLNGRLERGAELILRETALEKYLQGADIFITGEGRIDEQTAMGKAPSVAATLAKKHCRIILAFAGSAERSSALCDRCGFDAVFPILGEVCSLDSAMLKSTAQKNLTETAEQAMRLVKNLNANCH